MKRVTREIMSNMDSLILRARFRLGGWETLASASVRGPDPTEEALLFARRRPSSSSVNAV